MSEGEQGRDKIGGGWRQRMGDRSGDRQIGKLDYVDYLVKIDKVDRESGKEVEGERVSEGERESVYVIVPGKCLQIELCPV